MKRVVVTSELREADIRPSELLSEFKRLSVQDAQRYLDRDQFPAGSMGPKIAAAIHFLAHGGQQVTITSIGAIEETLAGNAGTTIHP